MKGEKQHKNADALFPQRPPRKIEWNMVPRSCILWHPKTVCETEQVLDDTSASAIKLPELTIAWPSLDLYMESHNSTIIQTHSSSLPCCFLIDNHLLRPYFKQIQSITIGGCPLLHWTSDRKPQVSDISTNVSVFRRFPRIPSAIINC